MSKGLIYVFLRCVLLVCFCQPLKADSTSTSDANVPKHDLKHPTDWLELGADLRFRYIFDKNAKLNNKAPGNERDQLRIRVRVGAKVKLTDDLDFNIRLMTEPRYWINADHSPNTKIWTYNEGLLDIFNLTWRKAFGLPLKIVAGRQEITLGSGWLICDGTPLDGSRTGFFDALRFTYSFDANTTADFILIDDHADSAKWLKPINDRDIDLSEQDERGGIFYFAQKTGPESGRDFYFIYQSYNHRNVKSKGVEGEVYTPGARFYGKFNDHWGYNAEFAPQFGHKNGLALGAFGTNDQLIYNFNDEKKNKLTLGYEFLSASGGDKERYFDRGWGRVDTWSALYQGNIDTVDGRAYESSNLHRPYIQWAMKPTEKTELQFDYNLLFAADHLSTAGTGALSKDGKFRGQLLRTILKYKMNKYIEHRVEGEVFFPGDYYSSAYRNVAVLVRYSFYFTW